MVKSAKQWMDSARSRPTPKMLFGVLWYEGELCILFSDTNMGKSVVAVQIADSISKGEPIPGFKLEAVKQKVLLLDCEQNEKQFEMRYSNENLEHYSFSENFLRAEINQDSELPKNCLTISTT